MDIQKQPNIFVKFIKSFTDFSIYRQVRRERTSKSIGYLILLALVLGIVFAVSLIHGTNTMFNEAVNFLDSEEAPEIKVENGRLYVDIDEPVVIEQDNQFIFILDMEGNYDLNDLAGYGTGYLITPERIIVSQAGGAPVPFEFAGIEDMQIDKAKAIELLGTVKNIVYAIIIIVVIIGTILLKFFESLLASLIALIVNSVLNTPYTFSELYKVGIYAITLPSIIIVLINSFYLPIGFGLKILIFYGLLTVILFSALKNMSREKEETSSIDQPLNMD